MYRNFLLIFLALLPFLVLLAFLDIYDISSSSEAREVHVSQVVYENAEWVLPLRNGILPSKPPLFHWVCASLALLFGSLSPFIARMSSALFGAGVLYITMLLAYKFVWRERERRKKSLIVAALTGVILSTSYEFLRLMGDARVDMAFCFFVTLALYGAFSIIKNRISKSQVFLESDANYYVIFFLGMGFATLTKGPLGIVLPALIALCALSYLCSFKVAYNSFLRPRLGWLITLLIAVSWYVFAFLKGGEAFVAKQVVFENVQRFVGGAHVNTQPFWFYLPSFLRVAFPWSFFFCGFLFVSFLERKIVKNWYSASLQRYYKSQNIFAIWVLVGLVFFTLSSGKRHAYLLPLLPGLSIYVAWKGYDWYESLSQYSQSYLRYINEHISTSLVSLCIVLCLLVELLKFPFSVKNPVFVKSLEWLLSYSLYFQVLLCIIIGICLVGASIKSFRIGVLSNWLSVFCLFSFVVFTGLGLKAHLKDFKGKAHLVNSIVDDSKQIAVLKSPREEYFDPLLYYLGRDVTVLSSKAATLPKGQYFLAKNSWLEAYLANNYQSHEEVQIKRYLSQVVDEHHGREDRKLVLFYKGT